VFGQPERVSIRRPGRPTQLRRRGMASESKRKTGTQPQVTSRLEAGRKSRASASGVGNLVTSETSLAGRFPALANECRLVNRTPFASQDKLRSLCLGLRGWRRTHQPGRQVRGLGRRRRLRLARALFNSRTSTCACSHRHSPTRRPRAPLREPNLNPPPAPPSPVGSRPASSARASAIASREDASAKTLPAHEHS